MRTNLDEDAFLDRVEQQVRSLVQYSGTYRRGHAMISISEKNRHFWSPWLHLEYRSTQEENVFGRFSPHPSIWTAFMFGYLALVVLSFFSLILGLSQQLVGQYPWGYLLLLIWGLIAVTMWIASKIGQGLAAEEMNQLEDLIRRCAEEDPLRNDLTSEMTNSTT